jgi:hypothetical protein
MLKKIEYQWMMICLFIGFILFLTLYYFPHENQREREIFLKRAESFLEHNWKDGEYKIDKINSNGREVVFYSNGKRYVVEQNEDTGDLQIVLK